jgi:hypothetical protein
VKLDSEQKRLCRELKRPGCEQERLIVAYMHKAGQLTKEDLHCTLYSLERLDGELAVLRAGNEQQVGET